MRYTILALAVLPALAVAHVGHHASADPLEDAVKARRAYFTLLGANMGPLAAMAKGEVEYDAAQAELHAANLAATVAYNPVPHFPAGTSNADLPGKTRSLPKIWEDFDGFVAKSEEYAKAVEALQAKAGGGRAELGSVLGPVGGTCKGCHDDYRAKDF